MTDPSHILRIAVARPLYQLLDYLPIPNTNAKLGARVCVPLGFSQCTGIVIRTAGIIILIDSCPNAYSDGPDVIKECYGRG